MTERTADRPPAAGERGGDSPRSDPGATLVEYALVLVALVVGLLVVLASLEDQSRAEVTNEFDCISDRPPPVSCQKRPITTTTASTITATTVTTLPASTTSSVP